MRHDPKYSQSHLSAVRQKSGHPDDRHTYSNTFYHHKQGYRKYDVDAAAEDTRRWSYRDRNSNNRGHSSVDGGTVSALSGSSHEAEKQWEWLESVLDKSKRNKETVSPNLLFHTITLLFFLLQFKVYIIGHIPPGSDERQIGEIPNGHTTFSEVNNLRYIRLVRKYSSIIQGQFFGHLHSDSFRIVYDDGKFRKLSDFYFVLECLISIHILKKYTQFLRVSYIFFNQILNLINHKIVKKFVTFSKLENL